MRTTLSSARPGPPAALADSHVHLDRYPPDELEAMLARAREAGVQQLLAIGVDETTSRAALAIARQQPGVLAAVGVHPTRLDPSTTLDGLRALADDPAVAAIGEVGLDPAGAAPATAQERFFAACLALAAERRLALSLHVVEAHERALEILARHGPPPSVVHYFQGDWALAERYLALGCWISVGKPVTRPERRALREAARQIPLDRLLLETDTYPLPGRSTEPRDVVTICQAVAELKGLPYETVAQATTASYQRLFGNNRRQ